MKFPTPDRILETGLGFWASRTLLSAVELDLFSALAEAGSLDADSLSDRLGLHRRSARDFLDALVALGFLDREDGRYRNTPDSDAFLDRAKPGYVGGLLEMAARRLYGFWGELTVALRTGEPQNECRGGEDLFAALYADPQRLEGFLRAMSGISAGAAKALAEKIPWDRFRSFADVGCAQGMVPVTIARAHPHLAGIGFDLPAVGPIFEAFVAGHGLADRVRFVAGDFFAGELPAADVIVLGHILHDWDLERKKALLAKVHRALTPGGLVVAYDAVIDDDRRTNAFGLLMSLNMLIETPGGFDYTGADCQAWMREVGFRETRVEPLVGPDSMVIGTK